MEMFGGHYYERDCYRVVLADLEKRREQVVVAIEIIKSILRDQKALEPTPSHSAAEGQAAPIAEKEK